MMERKKIILISISCKCCNTSLPSPRKHLSCPRSQHLLGCPRACSNMQNMKSAFHPVLCKGEAQTPFVVHRTEVAAPIQGNQGLSPQSPAFSGCWNLFFRLQMGCTVISDGRQSRRVRQSAQGKADLGRKGEIKNQGEAAAHPGRPSKAPS